MTGFKLMRASGPALVGVALLSACSFDGGDRATSASGEGPTLNVAEVMGGADTAGFARAVDPRAFAFPEDHGPHEEFRTEWWYITGNLESAGGRPFGFQFTIFRSSLSPEPPDSESQWATNQAYMAHLALTDVESGRFHAFDRFARGAAGLAGAEAVPFRVWLEDWELRGGSDEPFPITLRAAQEGTPVGLSGRTSEVDGNGEDGVALNLQFEPGKPFVLQGDAGLSQKGPGVGNASYYYSHTRMPTTGWVLAGGDTLEVTGLSWMDREWSTSALSDGLVGWDWFALQLEGSPEFEGWDLMLYQLRGEDGSAHPLSDGVLVDPDGNKTDLVWGTDLFLEVVGEWASPVDGTVYPSGWRIRIPAKGWVLEVEPVLQDQELNLAFRYWEGAVRVRDGSGSGAEIGKGYVELTGYGGMDPGR